MTLKFKYEDFLMEDIPNLMINIWSYSDDHGVGCTMCTTYKKFCIYALKKKWDNKKYKDVNEIIKIGLICQNYQVSIGIFYII